MKCSNFIISIFVGAFLLIISCSDDEDSCTETTWYQDSDGDGLGNPEESLSACEQPEGYVADNTDTDEGEEDTDTDGDTGGTPSTGSTPLSAFDEFNTDSVTISFDGDEITIESNGLPNHTSPYWATTEPLYIDRIVGDHSTPGTIRSGSYILTVSNDPKIAATSSATGLGAIGISVTGVPIYNDQERANEPLDLETTTGFDYAGGHNGPGGYHYHVESSDVEANTTLSHDDGELIGILADGFLLYGRREDTTGNYPSDLDVSGGHVGSTQHSDEEEFYHYHIINEFYVGSNIVLFGADLQGTPNTIL
ncbi:YHYH protein [Aquimarina pacifica]|uniref:YHYH protein n=1 Tax=Aquimarina pacifica TaxID=1296415 RepID=UPI0004710B2E|nr:YHYH protein [Aquimarina pacifica]